MVNNIDEGCLDICMTHQLHEGRQANAGAHHIRREGVPKTMGVCNFDSASLAMMAEKRAQTRGSHSGAASRTLERNE